MKTLRVDLGHRSYSIVVGRGLLRRAGPILSGVGFSSPPIIITNGLVWRMHGATLRESLDGSFGPSTVIRIGDGERYKSHETLLRIYDGLFRARADRRSWILAFGGGVIGDIAGFAAATFMRGIPYASVPTTLLAQVDSSIGGKVGINVPRGKNLIGAFHQPSAVLSDTDILATLPDRELASGLYEAVKCGAIRSAGLLQYIERHLPTILERRPGPLEHVILESSRIKAEVVSGDEREEELRMVLNYGHTVGHALEAATSYKRFKHGEAVAWGMIAAIGFGRELGMLDPADAGRLVRIIQRVADLPSLKGIGLPALWDTLKRDKKFRAGSIRLVLLPRLGATEIVSGIEPTHLKRFLRAFLEAEGAVI
jgi:3-dehydroquinate synthase